MKAERQRRIGRSAVILFGIVHRSLGHVVDSLREKVLEPLGEYGGVDVFYHSWDLDSVDNPRTGELETRVCREDVKRLLPDACGVFQAQEAFDETEDWGPLFARNPMRRCTKGEEAARATLKNYFRALESLERAWRFFEETKTGEYEQVVVTRPDLRFLDRLEFGEGEQEGPPSLWIPSFHGWGGVNDRFVMGREREVGIWCTRSRFARQSVLSGTGWNPETVLNEWLHANGVQVELFDFVFKRVRANGEVAGMDRGLRAGGARNRSGAGEMLTEDGASDLRAEACSNRQAPAIVRGSEGQAESVPAKRERFLILAREAGVEAENLRQVLEPLGKVEVVVDRPEEVEVSALGGYAPDEKEGRNAPSPIWIPDEEAEGYGGMMSHSGPFPWITAWSRALCHVARTLRDDEAVWFVEDDVAGDAKSFRNLVAQTAEHGEDLAASDIRTREADARWPHWSYADGFFSLPARGFQPLCRLSGRLVRAVLECQEFNGRCAFHEVMFASVARERGFSSLSWCRDPEMRESFGNFCYRPEVVTPVRGISHPVKDSAVHAAICGVLRGKL